MRFWPTSWHESYRSFDVTLTRNDASAAVPYERKLTKRKKNTFLGVDTVYGTELNLGMKIKRNNSNSVC